MELVFLESVVYIAAAGVIIIISFKFPFEGNRALGFRNLF